MHESDSNFQTTFILCWVSCGNEAKHKINEGLGTSSKGRHFGGQSIESLRSKLQKSLKMVNFCAVYGCSNRSNRERNRSFFRIPAIIYHSDEKTKNLSRERRQRWLAMIQRQDLTDSQIVSTRICSDHFISGKLFHEIML